MFMEQQRRIFIQNAGLLAATAAIAPNTLWSVNKPQKNWELHW